MMTRPEANGSAPNTARAISIRPAPTTGAPRISRHFKTHVVQHRRTRSRALPRRQTFNPKRNIVGYLALAMGEQCFYFAADH